MQPFHKATIPDSERAATRDSLVAAYVSGDASLPALPGNPTSRAEIERKVDEFLRRELDTSEVYLNDQYQVMVRVAQTPPDWPEMLHISIRRLDRKPVRDWREFQTIKNMLAGPECEAVELYPAESRLVDAANQYHLWAFRGPQARFPFGFPARFASQTRINKSVNRPFEV